MANLKANSTIGGYNVLTYGDIYIGKDSINQDMLANANDLRETWEKAVSAYNLAGTKLNASDNAVSASKLLNARTISVTGGATGSFTFDGTSNVSVSLSVNNTTHNHDSSYLKLTGGTLTGTLNANDIKILNQNVGIVNKHGNTIIRGSGEDVGITVVGNIHGCTYIDSSVNPQIRVGSTATNYSIYHTGNKPTKTDVGLSSVDNTADSNKNVLSATKLTTARTIGGVSFDGSANINLPGVNSQGNQNTTGNSATATKLQNTRTINGVNFDGTSNITIRQADYLGITNSSSTTGYGLSLYGGAVAGAPSYGIMFAGTGTFGTHGSVTSDWATYFTMAGSTSRGWVFKAGNTSGGNIASISATGIVTANTFNGNLGGNATTATTLQTQRTINGTNFNGSANITTANWGTARTLTIGSSGKSVNGSANISWSLAEIGAAPTSHTHTISQITGGTLGTLSLTSNNTSGTYNTRAIELREVNNVTTTQSSDAYAPAIGFHWGGRFGKKLFMNASGVLTYDGEFTSTRTKNPAYNDYAEYFPKNINYVSEAGDIIALSNNDESEVYELATDKHDVVVGVHSDEYGHLMGGEYKPDDFNGTQEEWNEKRYIPVGLVGRVYVKFKGIAKKGTMVVPSEIAGVGRAYNPSYDKDTSKVVGYIVENKNEDGIYKVRIKLGK